MIQVLHDTLKEYFFYTKWQFNFYCDQALHLYSLSAENDHEG